MNGHLKWLTFLVSLVSIAFIVFGFVFYAGRMHNRIEAIEQRLEQRGGVQISMEADQRITRLEARVFELSQAIE